MTSQTQNQIVPDTKNLKELRICIKGAGDLATGVAIRLHASGFTRIVMLETQVPLAVRRAVSFSETVYHQGKIVEGVLAKQVDHSDQLENGWQEGWIPIMVDPGWQILEQVSFDVVIDAIIAKRNLGSKLTDAPLVIGMGPGFTAGIDVHCVIETQRGHSLGRVIRSGQANTNTGIPGTIGGFSIERVLRAPATGTFTTDLDIGDMVKKGQKIGQVAEMPVLARIDGILRGLLRSGLNVDHGTKLGDIDPRNEASHYRLVSDKARTLGGSVLEAILGNYLTHPITTN